MRKVRLIIITLVFSSTMGATQGQTSIIAQLKSRFFHAGDDQGQADAALAICGQSFSLYNDTLYHYATIAKAIALKLRDRDRTTLADIGIENYWVRRNLFDSAIHLCEADLRNLTYEKNPVSYPQAMMEKCFCLMRANEDRSDLNFTFNFLAEADKYGDTLAQIYSKCIIGIVYRNMEQTDLAMNWINKAETTSNNPSDEAIKNEYGIFFLKGMMYNWRMDGANDPDRRLQDSLLAIQYLDRAISDSRKYENLNMLARALNVKAATIGNPAHLEAEGNYVREASHIYTEMNDTSSMLNTISPMCFYYIDAGHPEMGIFACEQGIRIASRNNSYPVIDLYEALSQCYYAAGNYPKYAETLNAIIRIRDSLYKVNTEQDFAALNANYENQKKENIIIRQKLDITSEKYSILLFSIASGILLIGIVLLYRHYRKNKKRMEQKSNEAVTSAREAERKRISADLHDNIGAYAAAAASSLSYIHAGDDQSIHRLGLLKNNIHDMISQLNDSIWALNKKEVPLTNVCDRFKLFVQKLEPSYPQISVQVEEVIQLDYMLSPYRSLHLFRIMQEAFNNALRHSFCSRILVTLQSTGKRICITIQDNGVGLADIKKNGNGIVNLKMRAAELGWQVAWNTPMEGGTSVEINSSIQGSTTDSALFP